MTQWGMSREYDDGVGRIKRASKWTGENLLWDAVSWVFGKLRYLVWPGLVAVTGTVVRAFSDLPDEWVWVGSIGLVLVIGGLIARAAPKVKAWHKRQAVAEACERADELSKQIYRFLDERGHTDPSYEGHPLHGLASSTTEETRNQIWADYGKRTIKHHQQTISQFNERFGAETKWLLTELHKINALTDEDLIKLDRYVRGGATNALIMAELAAEFGAAARRLGCVDGRSS